MMTGGLNDLREALGNIPDVLIGEDLERTIADALASIRALEQFAVEPSIVVVCGPSGSGKSTLVNALVGSDVVSCSPVRPTTTSIVAIGDASATTIPEAGEYVIVDSVPAGVVVVDTPAWDRAPAEVGQLMERAVLTIVVVTPARYGDQAVDEALEASQRSEAMQVIANRLPRDDIAREQISDAIHERLHIEPAASFAEGAEISFAVSPLESVHVGDNGSAQRRVLMKALAGTGRRIVQTVTERATDIGAVQAAIEAKAVTVIAVPDPSSVHSNEEGCSWDSMRTKYLDEVIAMISEVDDTIAATADTALAERFGDAVGEVDRDALEMQLDEWEQSVGEQLAATAVPRFRRASAATLLKANAWRLAFVHCDMPSRMKRLLKKHDPDGLRVQAVDAVRGVGDQARADRVGAWMSMAAKAGEYQPAVLAAAVDSVEPRTGSDG